MPCNVMYSLQPRDTCYVATQGLTELTYSGYQPHAYSWDDYPPLKDMLDAVRMFFNQRCSPSILLLMTIYLTYVFLAHVCCVT